MELRKKDELGVPSLPGESKPIARGREEAGMTELTRCFGLHLRMKMRNALAACLVPVGALLLTAGVILAAVMAVSNYLTLGPSEVRLAVLLTKIEDLPSPIAIGQENEVRFQIQANVAVTDATLWLRLSAQGVSLNDPTSVEVAYRHPDNSSYISVALVSADGDLRGALRSGWDIPAGFDDIGRVRLTFQNHAPEAFYSADLWVEGTLGPAPTSPSTPTPTSSSTPTPTPPSTPTPGGDQGQSFVFDAFKDGFVGTSGTNADGSSVTGLTNPNLTIKAGETVQMTIVHGDSVHLLSVYTSPCPDGFCDTLITGGQSANVSKDSSQASITFSRPAAGETLYFICDFHPDTMNGLITVVP